MPIRNLSESLDAELGPLRNAGDSDGGDGGSNADPDPDDDLDILTDPKSSGYPREGA